MAHLRTEVGWCWVEAVTAGAELRERENGGKREPRTGTGVRNTDPKEKWERTMAGRLVPKC